LFRVWILGCFTGKNWLNILNIFFKFLIIIMHIFYIKSSLIRVERDVVKKFDLSLTQFFQAFFSANSLPALCLPVEQLKFKRHIRGPAVEKFGNLWLLGSGIQQFRSGSSPILFLKIIQKINKFNWYPKNASLILMGDESIQFS
jgi:hypothetical protein